MFVPVWVKFVRNKMFSPNITNYVTAGVKISVFAQDNISVAINQSKHLNYVV